MNCSNETLDNLDENWPYFVSVSVNVAFTLASAVIIYFSSKYNRKKFKFVKFDFFLSSLIVLSGIVEVLHLVDASLNFCQTWIEFVVSLTTCVNVVVVLPTFYVNCIFKCRSRRRFVANVAIVASFLGFVEICRFFRLSQNVDELTQVRSGLSFMSLALKGGLCSALMANLFSRGCGGRPILSFEVRPKIVK